MTQEVNEVELKTSLFKKLLEARKQITLVKGSKNPFHKNNYASLPDILAIVNPIFNDLGLILKFDTVAQGGNVMYARCLITDVDTGQADETVTFMGTVQTVDGGGDKGAQKVASHKTYNFRYVIQQALGLTAEEDDDAETAVGRGRASAPKSTKSSSSSAAPKQKKAAAPKGNGAVKAGTSVKDYHNTIQELSKSLISSGKITKEDLQKILKDDFKVSASRELNEEQSKAFIGKLMNVGE